MPAAVVSSAPGKVVLSGEYAVLDGAPAVAMAIDRRASAGIEFISPGGGIEYSRVYSHPFADRVGRFRVDRETLDWQEGGDHFKLFDACWRACRVHDVPAMDITLDTREFYSRSETKFGVGSSAALTVALCAALQGDSDRDSLMHAARRAHSDLQGQVGSGVDIACSLIGGLIAFQMAGPGVKSLAWPEGLHYRLLWSGVAASTVDRISKLAAAVAKPSRIRLVTAAERMAEAWSTALSSRVIEEYRHYIDELQVFSIDHDLGVFSAGHDEVERTARRKNLIYKPCGAGGGDVGIVLGDDEAVLDEFVATLPSGFSRLEASMSEAGVTTKDSSEADK